LFEISALGWQQAYFWVDVCPRNSLVSQEFFFFRILGGTLALSEPFLGEIIDLSRRTGLSAEFNKRSEETNKHESSSLWDPLLRLAINAYSGRF
jgi:hypothetical protein